MIIHVLCDVSSLVSAVFVLLVCLLSFPSTPAGMPDGLLMLRNCFLYFAVQHRFGCSATEHGFDEDIGTIEI